MALSLLKLRSRIFVSSVAVFIFLSVSCAEERTRCYWCGPLAEQVHRSQRAPSCEIFNLEQQETLCDQGYTHCAIVAASPPYAESRICVKFYQDECYSLYCNSTKTWRMVCACRGDLCNGPRTTRETQAFALLPKFGKTKPGKRNFISQFISVKTRTPNDEDTVIIISKENETIHNIQSDQPMQGDENISNLFTPTPKHAEDNIIIVHGNQASLSKEENSDESKKQSIEEIPAAEDKHLDSAIMDKEHDKAVIDKHLDNAEIDTHLGNVDKNLVHSEAAKRLDNAEIDTHLGNLDKNLINTEVAKHLEIAEADKHLDNSEIGKHLNDSEVDKRNNTEAGKHPDNAEVENNLGETEAGNLTSAEMDRTTTVTTAAAEIVTKNHDYAVAEPTAKIAVQCNATPSKIPPPEALQQNFTPTKPMELTTMGTVAISTENHIIETTLPTEVNNTNKKNNGTHNLAHLIIYVISFVVHFSV